jgi:arylsulfatase A-like enzyme
MWLADRFAQYVRKDRPADRPFFAFVGFPDPHHPFTPPADVVREFADAPVQEPVDLEGRGLAGLPALAMRPSSVANLTPEERRTVIRYTYAMVHLIDRAVGRIVAALQETGLWEDTILVFTSDHGDFLCDHGLLRKGHFGSDALLRVPCLIRAPGAGWPARVDLPVSNCDLVATLAALTDVTPPVYQHGEDIAGLLKNGAEHHALAFASCGVPRLNNFTIYDRRHRLTYYPGPEYLELFDHQADPAESRNLAQDPAKKEVVVALRRALEARVLRTCHPILNCVGAW